MRRDATLTARVQPRDAQGDAPAVAAAFRRLRALPARSYAAAALTAVLVGIVVNALTLQHARHPAPFFAHASLAPTTLAAAPPAEPARPAPPARPVALGLEASAAVRSDAIGDMLRADQERETQRELAQAQGALIRLGYVVKADGEPGAATTAALREFEHARGLPLSGALTPKLLKTLTAAADAAGR